MVMMPLAPRPVPPQRPCICQICACSDTTTLTRALMDLVAENYEAGELETLVRLSRAALLPPDPAG
jgi:hypothetical protein